MCVWRRYVGSGSEQAGRLTSPGDEVAIRSNCAAVALPPYRSVVPEYFSVATAFIVIQCRTELLSPPAGDRANRQTSVGFSMKMQRVESVVRPQL